MTALQWKSVPGAMCLLAFGIGCGDAATAPEANRSPAFAATVGSDRTIKSQDVVGAFTCSNGAVTMLMSLTQTSTLIEAIPGGGSVFRSVQIFKGTGVPPVGTDPETGAPLPAADGTGYRFFQSRTDIQRFEPTGNGDYLLTTTTSFTARSFGPGPDARLHASYRQTFNSLTGEIAFKPGEVYIDDCTGK